MPQGIKKFWTPEVARRDWRQLMLMRLLIQCYQFTWDPDLLALAEATTDTFYDPEGELLLSKNRPYHSSTYKTQVDVAALLDAWRITGQRRYYDMALKVSDYWWKTLLGAWPIFYFNPQGRIGQFLYDETGDPSYAQGLLIQMRQAATACDPETGHGDRQAGRPHRGRGCLVRVQRHPLRPGGRRALRRRPDAYGGLGRLGRFRRRHVSVRDEGRHAVADRPDEDLRRQERRHEGRQRRQRQLRRRRSDVCQGAGRRRGDFPRQQGRAGRLLPPDVGLLGPAFCAGQSSGARWCCTLRATGSRARRWPPRRAGTSPSRPRPAARRSISTDRPWSMTPAASRWPTSRCRAAGPICRPTGPGCGASKRSRPGSFASTTCRRSSPPAAPDSFFMPPVEWVEGRAADGRAAGSCRARRSSPGPAPTRRTRPSTSIPTARSSSTAAHRAPTSKARQFLPFPQGTIEFFVKATWDVADLPDGTGYLVRLIAAPEDWTLGYMKNSKSENWMASHCLYGYFMTDGRDGRTSMRDYRRTVFQPGQWTHVAWVWGPKEYSSMVAAQPRAGA